MYKNPFELFGLPITIYVHESTLNERYKEMMKDLHPDQFSGDDAFMKKADVAAENHSMCKNLRSNTLKMTIIGIAKNTIIHSQ